MAVFGLGKSDLMFCIEGTKNQQTREDWLEETIEKIPQGSRILDAGQGEQKYKILEHHPEPK